MQIMAEEDRIKWDSRYRENPGDLEPSPLLTRFAPLSTVGKALDIACGNGRNSIYLAERGFFVDAVDISTVATNRLAGRSPNINAICTDLDAWIIPQNRYELIVNIRFLDRRIFPMIRNGLKPGGVLIFESFLDREEKKYCLKPNELIQAFQSFRILYYEERKANRSENFDQIASLVGRKVLANTVKRHIIRCSGQQSTSLKEAKGGFQMANCGDMKEGNLYRCETCGLELEVKKTCTCTTGSESACSVPLMCCGQEMTPKNT
ncbi:MAG: class I SAM-dependent methyltransferase [Desulfobacterales bacterium]|nr:class I SAM-dependent methyltransferase [Desulfobacterales bacterium]